jgi:hypothetical protein
MLNKSEIAHFVSSLSSRFWRKSFHFTPFSIVLSVGLLQWPLLWCFPCMAYFPAFLSWRVVEYYVFSMLFKMTICFLSFILLILCIVLTDLPILNHPFIPWMNPTWSWWIIFWYAVGLCLLAFSWGFLYLCPSRILFYSFLFVLCSYLFLVIVAS